MTLADIIADVESREKTLTVLNRNEPEPIVRMLERMVDAPDVTVQHDEPPGKGPADVVVVEDDGQERLAISSIADVGDSVLMVNADLYITGARKLDEVETPDVLTSLAGTTFTVSGKQKMLLIEISRHIESLALAVGDCTLHSGFQYLSRVDDERGTRRVYDRLADAGVDVNVYGVPDVRPDLPDSATVHGEDTTELRQTWFVVTENCPDDRKAALVAEAVGDHEWSGLWTFDPQVVDRVASYLRDTYGE